MARGYSLVYDEKEQHLIKSLGEVQLGDLVVVKLADGQLDCQVWGMKEDAKEHGEGRSGTGV
ncbi:Exodeoxyribonuclease 7 large subunit [compost metagenome]